MSKKNIVVIGIILAIVAFLAWIFYESTKPVPWETIEWNSRNHLPQGTNIDYIHNSQPNLTNGEPPTSGDHYPSWITKGFYDTPRLDGNVVHSQEHGYIIIWYDCSYKSQGLIPTVYAQSLPMTTGSEGSASATLESMPKAFNDSSCDNLKNKIKDIFGKIGPHKMVVMPRAGMDAPVILTAWGKMEKLSGVDFQKIKDFTDTFRDHGPELTDEP